MDFSVLSYNTLFNSAVEELPVILKKYSPDIICLQETLTEEKNLKKIENWFNIITPKNKKVEILKSELQLLTEKKWEVIYK